MSTYAEDDLEKTLFICQDGCGQFYVLSVAASAKKQECPESSSHGYMGVVTSRTDWAVWNTCPDTDCESYLATAVDTDDRDKCEKCGTLVVAAGDLNLSKLPDSTAAEESEEMHGSVRALKSEIEKHKEWKTSHHSDTTSKGVVKTGTYAAAQRHTKADGATAKQAKKKVIFLNEALTAVIKWRLKKGEGMTRAEIAHYKQFVGEARGLIARLGGTPVTEDDFSDI